MKPIRTPLTFRQFVRTCALLVWAATFVMPLTAVAQETTSESSAGASDLATASPPAEAASAARDTTPAHNGSSSDSGVLAELMSGWDISADQVATLERVRQLEAKVRQEIAALEAGLEPLEERLTYFQTSSVVLDEQLADESLPEAARQGLGLKAATVRARLEVTRALTQGISRPVEGRQELVAVLGERAEELDRQAQREEAQARLEQVRMGEANAAEKAALAEAERVRARETRERDAQVRRLIAQRREVLEEIAEVAGDQSQRIQQAGERRAERGEVFAGIREELEAGVAGLSSKPSQSEAKKEVDPLFQATLEHRRQVRGTLQLHEAELDQALEEAEEAEEALEAARAQLDAAKAELASLGETVVGEQKVELAKVRLELRRRQLEARRDIVSERQQRLVFDREQLQYYNQTIERLLPKISEEQHDAFYSVFSDENWQSAWFVVRQALQDAVDIVEMRFSEALTLPSRLTSVELWGWILGLLGWFLLWVGTIFVTRQYTDSFIRRLAGWALKRRFFRRRARLTIKAAEVLRSIIRPVVLYVVLDRMVGYVVETFPELIFLNWAVNAVVLYWIVMTLVKVMVLPRRFREAAGRSPAPELVDVGATDARASLSSVDVISIEISRARKLVRSVRIVLIFWLLDRYLPMAAVELLGHSVLTWLVEQVFVWGLINVVYMVLSTWKDDIAALFERLAKDRMPRAVDFVVNHKDRYYGVLLIAVAFVYVAFREVGKFVSTQARDTEWSKRLSNFVFRKRIEMQQRERTSQEAVDVAALEDLPDDYVQLFANRPLAGDAYKIDRPGHVEAVVDEARSFLLAGRAQGSVAISAEQGLGKTTLLNDIGDTFAEEFSGLAVRRVQLDSKVVDEQAVLAFVAEVFELDEVPKTRVELVDRLHQLEPSAVLLDDCHHFFVREIGGFSGLDTFLEVVNMTDHVHFWVLTFNKYAWSFINRVRPRKHYFGHVIELDGWSAREIQDLVQRRNALAGRIISFTDLVVAHDQADDDFFEIIKTANGYFRLLHEFSGGNPMVSLEYWKRSVNADDDGGIQVSLFRKPTMQPLNRLGDDYLFALSAIAQHGEVDSAELAQIINLDRAFCEMALNYFVEHGIVELDAASRRVSISPLYFRQVVKLLSVANFLWD